MSSAGRFQLVSDWNLAFQSAGTKTVLGQGVGGAAGWSPKWGDFLLERAYLQGDDFFLSGTTGNERVFFEVEKNGTTQLYDLTYTPAGGTGAAELHIVEDTTQHVITQSDYICATMGHRNYTTGALISKDVAVALEGRYITGPLAGQRVHIGRRGVCRGSHTSGTMNGVQFIFNFLGVTAAAYVSGTGYKTPTDYKGFIAPVPIRLSRQWMIGKVSNPTILPADNDLVLRTYVDDPTGTADMECVQSLNVGIGREYIKAATSTTIVDAGQELFFSLQQVRNATAANANLIDVSVYLEWEYI